MRPPRVVASAALIAALASVAVPGVAGSRTPSRETPIDPAALTAVGIDAAAGTAGLTTPTYDPAEAAPNGQSGLVLREPGLALPTGAPPPLDAAPAPEPLVVIVDPWRHDPEESWYGPGFYGQRTACGETLTATLLGVASQTLPCGTLVEFRNPRNGRIVTVPVVDRGPYVPGRQWDLTGATCLAIDHCWTGPLDWRLP